SVTAAPYRHAGLFPEKPRGAPAALKVHLWARVGGRYVAKNLFSGGTRDQVSLALRLPFALATLPKERGALPGFIVLDEPLSSFDEERARTLVSLLTRGTIAQQFPQVLLISPSHTSDR